MNEQRETLGKLLQEHLAQAQDAGVEPLEVQTPGTMNWTDKDPQAVKIYGEQIAEIKAQYSDISVVPEGPVSFANHDQNAANFFAQERTQTVSRVLRGADPSIVQLDCAGYLAEAAPETAENPQFIVYEDMSYLSENPSDKIEKILQKLEDEGLEEPTNEQLADHFNQELIAKGRNPVFSAQMLAAQNAAALRKQQQNRKKKRK